MVVLLWLWSLSVIVTLLGENLKIPLTSGCMIYRKRYNKQVTTSREGEGGARRVQWRFETNSHYYNHSTSRKLSQTIMPFNPPFSILNEIEKEMVHMFASSQGIKKQKVRAYKILSHFILIKLVYEFIIYPTWKHMSRPWVQVNLIYILGE
jgi:hypothetical protein